MNFVAGVMFNNPRTLTPLQYPEHMMFIRGGSKLFPHSTLQVKFQNSGKKICSHFNIKHQLSLFIYFFFITFYFFFKLLKIYQQADLNFELYFN